MVERGFSGGPVFGRSDTVIFGAITAKARDHWVAYAIPAEAIERALPAAKAEHKTGALDHAAPLARWDLPEQVGHLRRLLEARMDRHGRREFVQVLRLLEVFPEAVVAAAVTDSMRLGAISFDAVKQLALGPLERRPARLDLRAYSHLPKATVPATAAGDYTALLGTAAMQ